jgi:hypothetical protein
MLFSIAGQNGQNIAIHPRFCVDKLTSIPLSREPPMASPALSAISWSAVLARLRTPAAGLLRHWRAARARQAARRRARRAQVQLLELPPRCLADMGAPEWLEHDALAHRTAEAWRREHERLRG